VNHQLLPNLAADLGQSLGRPIQLGDIQHFSWTGLNLGSSAILATDLDADEIQIERVQIRFNPLTALLHRKVAVSVTLVRPVIYVDQNADGEWVTAEILLDDDEWVEVEQLHFQDATVILAPYRAAGETPAQVELRGINASVQIQDDGEQLAFQLNTALETGGSLEVEGDANLAQDRGNVTLSGRDVAIAPFATLMPPEITLDGGEVSAEVTLGWQADRPLEVDGTVDVQDLAMRAEGEPNPFTQAQMQLRLDDEQIFVEAGSLNFGQIPFRVWGVIDLAQGLDLRAEVDYVSADAFMDTFNLHLPFPASGALMSHNLTVTGPFNNVVFAGTVTDAAPIWLDRVQLASARTDFTLNKTTDDLELIGLEFVTEAGGSLQVDAQIKLKDEGSDVDLQARLVDVSADAIAQLYDFDPEDITLGTLNANAQVYVSQDVPQVTMGWTLADGDFPATGTMVVNDDVISLRDTQVQVAGGEVAIAADYAPDFWQAQLMGTSVPLSVISPDLPGLATGNVRIGDQGNGLQGETNLTVQVAQGNLAIAGQMVQDRWQAQVNTGSLPLIAFAPELSGVLDGSFTLGGTLADLSLRGIRADGDLRLTDAVSGLADPITAEVQWQGDRLHLTHLETTGLTASGWITPAFQGTHAPTIADVDLAVALQEFDLARLASEDLPVNLAGLITAEGRLTGNLDRPNLSGTVQVNNLQIHTLAFDPLLQGTVDLTANGGQVSLIGTDTIEGDRIALRLDQTFQPTHVALRYDQATLDARFEQNHWLATLRNLSLDQVGLADQLGIPTFDGILAADIDLDMSQPEQPLALATVRVEQLALGAFSPAQQVRYGDDQFVGTIRYQDGVIALTNSDLRLGESHYAFTGHFNLDNSNLTLDAIAHHAELQDLLAVVQWVQPDAIQAALDLPLPAYLPSAAAGPTISVDQPVDLSTIAGAFSGSISVQGNSLETAIATVQLQGQDWQLGHYGVQQITLQGNNARHHCPTTTSQPQFGLESLSLNGLNYGTLSGTTRHLDTALEVTGAFCPDGMAGEIRLGSVPLDLIGELLNLPVPMTGNVGAIATFSGDFANPTLDGTLTLENAQINHTEPRNAAIGFDYHEQRFNLNSWSELPDSP
jgi:translocation and assembly module TamB